MYIFWLRSVFELALIMEQEPSWCSVGRFECQTLFLRQEDHESELFFLLLLLLHIFFFIGWNVRSRRCGQDLKLVSKKG